VDERFALHNVLYNSDTHKLIMTMMKQAFLEHIDTPVSYNVFHGDPEAMVKEEKPESDRVSLDFSKLMRLVNEEDPDHMEEPDYNDPKSHLTFIDATLLWAITTPQLMTNSVWCDSSPFPRACVLAYSVCGHRYMMLFMCISEGLVHMIRAATHSGIGRVYFEGSETSAFVIEPYETRFAKYLCGVLASDNKTTLIASKLTPECVTEEWIVYQGIVDDPATAENGVYGRDGRGNVGGGRHRRHSSVGDVHGGVRPPP